MSDFPWISTAPAHASNLRPLRNSFSHENTSLEAPLREIAKKIEEGLPLQPGEFPTEIFGAPHAKEKDYNLPDLFHAYGFWAVSKKAADVLRQFDLGGGALYPVRVLKKDRATPVEGEWFCINFGNRKETFSTEESRNIHPFVRDISQPALPGNDGDIALSNSASHGADIWIEPRVFGSVFLSGPLGAALKKAKADKGFFLKKCRVI